MMNRLFRLLVVVLKNIAYLSIPHQWCGKKERWAKDRKIAISDLLYSLNNEITYEQAVRGLFTTGTSVTRRVIQVTCKNFGDE